MKLERTNLTEMLATMPDERTINLVINYGTLNDYNLTKLLDDEVSPRIVECVNALEGIEDPAAFMESVRERARWAYKALRFIGEEEVNEALEHLSALIGSLPVRQ